MSNNLIYGQKALSIFSTAKKHNFAIPAVNVTSSSNINASMEAASQANSPLIIQFSNSGSAFLAGKSIDNKNQQGSIAGSILGATQIHLLAKQYGANIMIHTDHCAKKLLPWVDGLLDYGETFYNTHGYPFFGSHMIDLSAESLIDNIEISKKYLARMAKLDMILEIELGITGGVEDGVDNTGIDNKKLYTQPEDVEYAYRELSKISPNFTIAASFGNVHGVYKPGNVKLQPIILNNSQNYVKSTHSSIDKPLNLVFHGGSGSTPQEIQEAISYGVIKMNLDTDLQWAYWSGIKEYYQSNSVFLQSQIGNSVSQDSPNKNYYDPRVWLREAETSYISRLKRSFEELNCIDKNNLLD
jgi:fructose-bisphosphate aldolase, class II